MLIVWTSKNFSTDPKEVKRLSENTRAKGDDEIATLRYGEIQV